MVYNIFVSEAKGLNAIEALEKTKTDAANNQIGFLKGAVQNANNNK